jgi:hypothetical protein
MCDTICSLAKNNKDSRASLFGKNSDRDPNEIQVVEFYPRTNRDGKVHTTYIDVEYTGETNAVILSRPLWMWGAEIGVNQKGVAAGNEAIFSTPRNKTRSLLGMDLLRLGLERGNDANSTVKSIIEYLEKYGQGGSNDQYKNEYYNNSFLITDGKRILELYISGKEYLLREAKSFDTISNSISRERESEKEEALRSPNFMCREDFLYTRLGRGLERSTYTTTSLRDKSQETEIRDMFRILRHHNGNWVHPKFGSNEDVCMHAGPLSRKYQTANSIVVEIGERRSVVWSTFSSNPCISLYKPILFSEERAVGLQYDRAYWLKSEETHRRLQESESVSFLEAIDSTDRDEERIIHVTQDIRERWLKGENTETEEFENIFDEIREIDSQHIAGLQTYSGSASVSGSVNIYRNWWKGKDKALNITK